MIGNVMDNGLESNSLDYNWTLTLIGWYYWVKETAIDLVVKYTGTVMDYYYIAFCVMQPYTLECMVYVREYCRCNDVCSDGICKGWCLTVCVCQAMRY